MLVCQCISFTFYIFHQFHNFCYVVSSYQYLFLSDAIDEWLAFVLVFSPVFELILDSS
jgi:hypothetical protein